MITIMPNRVLFCATVDTHFKAFHLPYLKWFKQQGWEVHVAANGTVELPYVDHKFDIPIERSPRKLGRNRSAYVQLTSLIEEHNYQIIHCHTPMGGVLARLAARKARKQGTRVLYTAHGFHFCKGAPLVNWLLYYPIERLLSRCTDCLITINQEDYSLAVQHRFKANKVEHVHGVGVDTERFQPVDPAYKRESRSRLGYGPDNFLMFYAAEFNTNKNQQLLIQALALMKNELSHVKLLLAGEGALKQQCRELAHQLGVADMVDFLGHRNDIERILPLCDVAVASSVREGLPVNIMEAMACGLPIVATDNRGHRELVRNDVNGWIIAGDDKAAIMYEKLKMLAHNNELKYKLGMSGRGTIEQSYSIDKVLEEKSAVYSTFMEGKVGILWAVQ